MEFFDKKNNLANIYFGVYNKDVSYIKNKVAIHASASIVCQLIQNTNNENPKIMNWDKYTQLLST